MVRPREWGRAWVTGRGAQVKAAAQHALDTFGAIDVLVNNAHIRHVRNVSRTFEASGPNALEDLVQALGVDVNAESLRATGGALFGNQLPEAATGTGIRRVLVDHT